MNGKGFWIGLAVGIIATSLFGQWVLAAAGKEAAPSTCISAETVAGYVHSVIQADRTFYATDIVERMQLRGIVFGIRRRKLEGDRQTPATSPILDRNRAAHCGRAQRAAVPVDQQLADQ